MATITIPAIKSTSATNGGYFFSNVRTANSADNIYLNSESLFARVYQQNWNRYNLYRFGLLFDVSSLTGSTIQWVHLLLWAKDATNSSWLPTTEVVVHKSPSILYESDSVGDYSRIVNLVGHSELAIQEITTVGYSTIDVGMIPSWDTETGYASYGFQLNDPDWSNENLDLIFQYSSLTPGFYYSDKYFIEFAGIYTEHPPLLVVGYDPYTPPPDTPTGQSFKVYGVT